jgi:hypothetical protein
MDKYGVRRPLTRQPERLPSGKRIHEGMDWGAVAQTRTTATGPDEKTLGI